MTNKNTKTCSKCHQEKTLKEFYKDSRAKDGRRSRCISCISIERYPSKRRYPHKAVNGKKICLKCGLEKLLEEFAKDARRKHGRGSRCKTCINLETRHPDPSKQLYKAVVIDGKKKCKECGSKKDLKEFIKDTKSINGRSNTCKICKSNKDKAKHAEFSKKVTVFLGGKCAICGLETDHFEVYECHHENPTEKDYKISSLLCKDWDSIVVPELRKCILLCANCHKSLTSKIARSKTNRSSSQKRSDNRTDIHKQKCVEYIGNKCQICGLITEDYTKYDFHHVDSSTKEACIGNLRSKDWNSIIQPELDKCCLLCRNCHASVHFGRYNSIALIPGPIEIPKITKALVRAFIGRNQERGILTIVSQESSSAATVERASSWMRCSLHSRFSRR